MLTVACTHNQVYIYIYIFLIRVHTSVFIRDYIGYTQQNRKKKQMSSIMDSTSYL
jgi:hypothetical protein